VRIGVKQAIKKLVDLVNREKVHEMHPTSAGNIGKIVDSCRVHSMHLLLLKIYRNNTYE